MGELGEGQAEDGKGMGNCTSKGQGGRQAQRFLVPKNARENAAIRRRAAEALWCPPCTPASALRRLKSAYLRPRASVLLSELRQAEEQGLGLGEREGRGVYGRGMGRRGKGREEARVESGVPMWGEDRLVVLHGAAGEAVREPRVVG